jgi:hypothetical protein
MASLVTNLQRDILNSKKSVTEILRTAKLISAKLGLTDISEWINAELTGYSEPSTVPAYREITGGTLQVHNPYRGWELAGQLGPNDLKFRSIQPVSEIEDLAKAEFVTTTPPKKFPLRTMGGGPDGLSMQFHQRIVHSPMEMRGILEAIKEQVLNWAIELEQRGILGEDMSFDNEEKQKAHNQTFNIQHFTGVLGDVKNSSVNVSDYSSIHQALRNQNVPQGERNEIENILDGLKQAKPHEKPSLVEKGKAWIVNNQELLGASASIVRKALGIPDVA